MTKKPKEKLKYIGTVRLQEGGAIQVIKFENLEDEAGIVLTKRLTPELAGEARNVSDMDLARCLLSKSKRTVYTGVRVSYEAAIAIRDTLVSMFPYEIYPEHRKYFPLFDEKNSSMKEENRSGIRIHPKYIREE
ncbi:MAG: hypothetical protein AABX28_01850 [Nanoarchaeota archaeon]